MKKLLLFLCGVFCAQFIAAQGFTVEKTDVEIHIDADGYFDVVEYYEVYFTENKHGIFRNIQTKYDLLTAEGKKEVRKIELSKIKVPGDKFSVDPSFIRNLQNEVEIKIGDKDKWVSGNKKYEIRYRVKNAFLFEESQVQFYWNIKSANWIAPFREVNFRIIPPEGFEASEDNFFVYSGGTGVTSESDAFDISFENGTVIGKSRPGFQSNYGENVTVLLKLPPNAVKESKPLWPFWSKYGWTFFLGGFLIVFYRIWKKYGKDDKVIATISYFPPNDIHPAMAGFLIDDKADTHDLISLIPYWGSKGIIRVEHIPKKGLFSKEDTKLVKLKSLPNDVPSYERQMFDGLFDAGFEGEQEVLISSLKDSFYNTMNYAKGSLKAEAQVYYDPLARKVKNRTIGGIILAGLLFGTLFLFVWGLFAAIALIPVVVLLLILSPYLEKKNTAGNEMLSDLKGFKQFIRVAEENKLKMLLKDDPHYFENTMAYAVAFGLFTQWAKKFEGLNIQPPEWYTSPVGLITMNSFANSFSSSLRTAQTTMVSTPSSSGSGGGGGGMSGGGFGGGGGGSW